MDVTEGECKTLTMAEAVRPSMQACVEFAQADDPANPRESACRQGHFKSLHDGKKPVQ